MKSKNPTKTAKTNSSKALSIFFLYLKPIFKQKVMLGFILFVGLLIYVVQMILVILFPGNDKFDKWGL